MAIITRPEAAWVIQDRKRGDFQVQVTVQDNNVEKAIKLLKRKLTKEGVFRQLKEKRWHEKPSDARRRKQRQARRRLRRQLSRARAREATRR